MDKLTREWFLQADYDLDSAEHMLRGGRNSYAIFMAHLAIEKALKGLWQARLRGAPPKTHNLLYLAERAEAELPEDLAEFVADLNGLSVATRYPEDLRALLADYPEHRTRQVIKQAREALKWIKQQP